MATRFITLCFALLLVVSAGAQIATAAPMGQPAIYHDWDDFDDRDDWDDRKDDYEDWREEQEEEYEDWREKQKERFDWDD